ncbi:DNA/RNA non-specific endonuclease [Kocuria palustris]|nr:DNA/RNA non-specific endonuclease [Kocuria palustris]
MSNRMLFGGLALGLAGLASFLWGSLKPVAVSAPVSTGDVLPFAHGGNEVFDPSQVRPQDFFKYGFPGPIHDMGNHNEFVLCFDRKTRNPYWVVEHITKDSIKRTDGVDRKKSVFKEDEGVPAKFRARLRDYFRSGYDRGHNAPAADAKFSQQAMDDTFLLTNISPQVGDGFNRDYWAYFEDFARRLTTKYDDVRIMTGPLYLPKLCPDGKYRVTYEMIGSPPNVAVPTHFFKLVVGERTGLDTLAVGAFVLPNEPIDNTDPLTKYQVPVEALERSSGLELLQKVPPNKKKDLCREVNCAVVVREFPQQVNNLIEGKKA